MLGITSAMVLDEGIQLLLSAGIVYLLYGTLRTRYAILPALSPLLMDADHFLPQYAEGIKAFHSALFVSSLALPFIIYAIMRPDRRMFFMGASIYVVLVFNMAVDLVEGGGISFFYPFADSRYVLSNGSSDPYISLLILIGFTLMSGYVLRTYLDLDRNGFTGEPQTGHS